MTDHRFALARLSRRHLLAAATAAAATGVQAQTVPSVEVLLVNAMISAPLKAIVEPEAGVRVNDGPFQSSTDSVSRLTAPGAARYDLICATHEFAQPVAMGARAGQEKVQPFDMSLIPGMATLAELARQSIGARDGNTYMIPLCWGFDTVLYNHTVVPENDPYTQSWSLLFEDRYAGRIGWWDVAHQMMMAAGLYLGHAEPEKMDRGQLAEVTRFLISKKRNVRTFYSTFAQGSALLASGEIVAGYGIAPMRVELQSRGFPINGAWVKEGVLSLLLSGFIPTGSRNVAAASRLVNALIGSSYASALTRACGYLSASSLATTGLTEQERRDFGYGMFDGSIRHYGLKFPTSMNLWIEAWSRVKSA